MPAIARWCFRHRFVVIAAWVLVLVGLGALSQAIKSDYNNSFSLPGTGSTTAQQLLAKAIPAQAGDSDTIVWQVSPMDAAGGYTSSVCHADFFIGDANSIIFPRCSRETDFTLFRKMFGI